MRMAQTSQRNRLPLASALVFLVVLIAGGGAGHAYALWSQSATTTVQAKAGILPIPTIGCAASGNQSVVVSWVPLRAGVTSYDVTVLKDDQVLSITSGTGATSETVTISPVGYYNNTYQVSVIAHYGSWQAKPAIYSGIKAVSSLLLFPSITC